jgi:hypothetical protein
MISLSSRSLANREELHSSNAKPSKVIGNSDRRSVSNIRCRDTNQLRPISVNLLRITRDWTICLITTVRDSKNIRPLLELFVKVLVAESVVDSSMEARLVKRQHSRRAIYLHKHLWTTTSISFVVPTSLISPLLGGFDQLPLGTLTIPCRLSHTSLC